MIGSNLVKRLVTEGHDVTVIDNLWRGRLEYLDGPDGRPVIDTATAAIVKCAAASISSTQ